MPGVKEEGSEHHRLVTLLIALMSKDGWQVTFAASDGYDHPSEVDGVMPDVVASKEGAIAYGQAETCESFQSDNSIGQMRVLSGRTMERSGTSIPLYLIVPRACYRDLLQMIDAGFARRDILPYSG